MRARETAAVFSQVHPCTDPEFSAGARCQERTLDDGSVLSLRDVVDDHGIQWVDFEPNDEPMWSTLRETVAAFLGELFQQGMFAGTTPAEAFFVRCGSDTTTQNDIDSGTVVIEIGFAPLRPAEFVDFSIRHKR